MVIQRTGSSPPELEFREGHMVLDGENLVGGWFEAKPKGWDVTKKHTVGLKAYIKKKRTGEITQFWKEDKQPGMIEKVAEVQGLRSVFPSEFGNLYIQEEITDMITPDTMAALPNGSPPEKKREADTSTFDKLAIERLGASYPNKHLDTFIEACAKAQADGPVTPEQLKEGAAETFNSFWDSFLKWCLAQGIKLQPDKEPPPKKDKPPKTTDQDASPWDPKKVGHQRAGNGIDSGYVKYIKDNTGSWDKAPREWKENAIGKWMSFAKQGKEGYEGKEFPLPLDVPGDELTGQEGSQEPGEGQTETDPGSGTLGEPQTTPQEPSGASQEGDQTESHTTLSDVQDKGLKEPSREDLILRLEQVKAKSQDAWLYGRVNAKIRDSEPDVNTMPMEQLEDWADQAEIAFRDMF
nr:hypothetical protein 8 [Dehalococcoidia bacterium]